jgi:hypothetical protein
MAAEPVEALDAVVRDGLLVMVTADGTELVALELETDRERWKVPLGPPAQAAIVHELDPGVLLVQTPTRYVAVQASTGDLLSTREAPAHWEFVWRGMGGCALGSECGMMPISCTDGRPLGPPLIGDRVWTHYLESDEDGGRRSESLRCLGELEVLGAGAGWSLYQVGEEIVAFDPQGNERWRKSERACPNCAALGRGMAPDARLCWTAARPSDTEVVVRAFSCREGTMAFVRSLSIQPAPYEGVVTGWIPEPPSVLVVSPGQAVALSPAGALRWSRPLGPGVMPVPAGLRLPSFPLVLPFRTLEPVDPATGRTLRSEPVPAGHEVRVAASGSLQVVPQGSTTDRAGSRVPAPEVFSFVRDPAGSRVLLEERTVLRLPGDGWVLGEHRSSRGTWLVVTEFRPGQPDRVHRLSVP